MQTKSNNNNWSITWTSRITKLQKQQQYRMYSNIFKTIERIQKKNTCVKSITTNNNNNDKKKKNIYIYILINTLRLKFRAFKVD